MHKCTSIWMYVVTPETTCIAHETIATTRARITYQHIQVGICISINKRGGYSCVYLSERMTSMERTMTGLAGGVLTSLPPTHAHHTNKSEACAHDAHASMSRAGRLRTIIWMYAVCNHNRANRVLGCQGFGNYI